MKKLNKILGIIAFVAVIGFLMAACDDDLGGWESGKNPFVGVWDGISPDGDEIRFEFTGVTFTRSRGFSNGTYTYVRNNRVNLYVADFYVIGSATVSGDSMTITEEGWGTYTLSRSNPFVGTWGGGSSGRSIVFTRSTATFRSSTGTGSSTYTYTYSGSNTVTLNGRSEVISARVSGGSITITQEGYPNETFSRRISEANPFVGVWDGINPDGDEARFVFGSSTFTVSWVDSSQYTHTSSGTYNRESNTETSLHYGTVGFDTATISGNSMTITGERWDNYTFLRSTPFVGTWDGIHGGVEIRFVFTNSTFTISEPDFPQYVISSGTYFHRGSNSNAVTTLNSSDYAIGTRSIGFASVSGNTMTIKPDWNTYPWDSFPQMWGTVTLSKQ